MNIEGLSEERIFEIAYRVIPSFFMPSQTVLKIFARAIEQEVLGSLANMAPALPIGEKT